MKQFSKPPISLTTSAYLLIITHGSQDYRSNLALKKLTQLIRMQIKSQGDEVFYPIVNTATLEFNSLPLHQQILRFARHAVSLGYQELHLLPLFLFPGVHVTKHLPEAIANTQTQIGQDISIVQLPYLGANVDLIQLWKNRLATIESNAVILFAHGTRLSEGNKIIETIAQQLGALTAYFWGSLSLDNCVTVLTKTGCKTIVILPHILFNGTIMDVITYQVSRLQHQLPQVELILDRPLGETVDLAKLIVETLKQNELRSR